MDTDTDIDFDDNHLDDDWIKEFKEIDKQYENYYLDDNEKIRVTYVYIDGENEIIRTKQEHILLRDVNIISREEIIGILKRNSIIDEIKYTVLSILKINIDLDPNGINRFINEEDYFTEIKGRIMTPIKHIDTITFERTIKLFKDLNEIIFVFHEKINKLDVVRNSNNVTKRIYVTRPEREKSGRKTVRKY